MNHEHIVKGAIVKIQGNKKSISTLSIIDILAHMRDTSREMDNKEEVEILTMLIDSFSFHPIEGLIKVFNQLPNSITKSFLLGELGKILADPPPMSMN